MPKLNWINRNQAEQTAESLLYHLLKFEQAYGAQNQRKISDSMANGLVVMMTIDPAISDSLDKQDKAIIRDILANQHIDPHNSMAQLIQETIDNALVELK